VGVLVGLLGLVGGVLARPALADPPQTNVFQSFDAALCSFPLGITVTSEEKPHRVGTGAVRLTGTSTVALQNLATGQTATLHSSGPVSFDPTTFGLSWSGHQLWEGSTMVPFLLTRGNGSVEPPNFALSTSNDNATVVDPCALVGPAPSTSPVTTPARWGLPQDALAQIAFAGLIPLLGFDNFLRHDHSHLDVIVNGQPVTVPAGIGQAEPTDFGPPFCPPGPPDGDCSAGDFFEGVVTDAPLHTHTSSGIIHVETDRPATFTLGQFFDEWGVRLSQTCVGGYCIGGGKELRVYVDGSRVTGDPRSVVITNQQEIAVVYGGPGDFGSVPSTYTGGWPSPGCGGAGEPSCF
jgi:hypothetical protein